jgi:hypothetical protein
MSDRCTNFTLEQFLERVLQSGGYPNECRMYLGLALLQLFQL